MILLIILPFIMFGWAHTESNDDITKIDKVLLYFPWNSPEYYYPDAEARKEAINSGLYIPGEVEPFDVDIHIHNAIGSRIFITTPRSRVGVPATLGYLVGNFTGDESPLIAPYPNFEMHAFDVDCDHIIGVYRIKVDDCNRLWVLDTGTFLRAHICPPKLLVFDLLTDQVISNHTFYVEALSRDPRLITPIVDIRNGDCDNTFVYIPDNKQYQIFVYDHKNQKSWRVYCDQFLQYEEFGVDFKATGAFDDDFQLTLGPMNTHDDRKLYFRGITSGHYGYVNTSLIRNAKRFLENPNANSEDFEILSYERARTGIEVMNKDGILFYRSGYENTIRCWTMERHDGFEYNKDDTVIEDAAILDRASSIKINTSEGREILLINSIPDNRTIYGRKFPNQTNYAIIGGYIDDFIRGKKCGPTSKKQDIY